MGSMASLFPSALESVTVEAYSGRDGQGAPSYAAAVTIQCVPQDPVFIYQDQVRVGGAGVDVVVTKRLFVDPEESYIPTRQDRVTHDGATYLVITQRALRELDGSGLSHYEILLKDT